MCMAAGPTETSWCLAAWVKIGSAIKVKIGLWLGLNLGPKGPIKKRKKKTSNNKIKYEQTRRWFKWQHLKYMSEMIFKWY